MSTASGGRVRGVLLTLAGAGTLAAAAKLDLGTLRAIGPGMFPAIVAVVLVLLGIATFVVAHSVECDEGDEKDRAGISGRHRAVVVVVAVLAFAALIETAGLITAGIALVTISARTRRDAATLDYFILAGVSILAGLIVVELLGLPVPLVPRLR